MVDGLWECQTLKEGAKNIYNTVGRMGSEDSGSG